MFQTWNHHCFGLPAQKKIAYHYLKHVPKENIHVQIGLTIDGA